ncbi:nicotinate mononucleotide-dependent phosphoribosyltransferase CobT [Leptolyngbya sp. PCC 6406]|uniref:nicotinate mononucleotide-dependent phosphoribosyltransferase CobT n=1 Tax=Leptolyngbya sp. PCC 6406 TaxID=1173264 RepID=UPI0002AD05EC|nr:TIGR00303 family protein [Leptolyngbya sp. PCC 6406]
MLPPMLRVYTQEAQGRMWLRRYWGHRPLLACVLGFTETGLVPGISAAGATPADRRITAIADAEFLYHGPQPQPHYPLPPLTEGISPAIISHSILLAQRIPLVILNAGLPVPPPVPHVDLGGSPAQGIETGQALSPLLVRQLFRQGLVWGHRLANQSGQGYVLLGECVVGGTTTALAILLGLGFPAEGKVSSSHPNGNSAQKQAIATAGLEQWRSRGGSPDPLDLVAAIGDPMQVVVAAMTIAATRHGGVLLAGGTQMLAVYVLARAIADYHRMPWHPEQVVVGTTRWVMEDTTGDAFALALAVEDVPLIATQLSFATSQYAQLRKYEQGYVKEGVAAGGCAIAATLYQNWQQAHLLTCIERLVARCQSAAHPQSA